MADGPSPWGWGRAERAVLAAIVAVGAVGLLIVGRPGEGPDGDPPGRLVIDVNTAPPSVLLALPGLGPSRVERIVAAREGRPFDSLDDLARRVKGIGPATIEGIRPFARVGPARRDDGGRPGTAPSPRPSPRDRGEGG